MPQRSFVLLLALACGASDPADREHSRYCAALCERERTCTTALPGCRALCENDPGARGRSGESWALQATCIGAQGCEGWRSDASKASCLERALSVLTPSDSCVEYCADGAARAFECGGGYSIADCVRGPTCTYRDEVLTDANACNAELDCEARASCFMRVFGSL